MLFHFENRRQSLLPTRRFLQRMLRYSLIAGALLGVSLLLGMLGYHFVGELPWIDAFLNAAMILTGMGPVDRLPTDAGKLFAGLYALYSGIAFLSTATLLFAPVAHRFLHRLHVEDKG
ncbi:MAG: hypothetical protein ICV83_05870 [Cytophagales bacterium]|nr:hypothetical protein [Cytophagales bacterium]